MKQLHYELVFKHSDFKVVISESNVLKYSNNQKTHFLRVEIYQYNKMHYHDICFVYVIDCNSMVRITKHQIVTTYESISHNEFLIS